MRLSMPLYKQPTQTRLWPANPKGHDKGPTQIPHKTGPDYPLLAPEWQCMENLTPSDGLPHALSHFVHLQRLTSTWEEQGWRLLPHHFPDIL